MNKKVHTGKLGYNEQLGTGQIRSLQPGFIITGVHYNRVDL